MSDHNVKYRGVVLSSEEFKDKDKMLTILTPDSGVIRVCAKGATKPGSTAAAVSVPFMLCDLVVSISHGYLYLKEGNIIQNNMGIYSSLEAMASAGHISECLIESIHQSENSREAYELTVYAFYALAASPDDHLMIVSAFNWRLLYILGLNVTYDVCSSCSEPIDRDMHCLISLNDGDILCPSCSERIKDRAGYRLISSAGITALNFFSNAPLEELFKTSANSRLARDLAEFTIDYLSIQFDRPFDALKRLDQKLSYDPMRREE